jgi:hypothetical protein
MKTPDTTVQAICAYTGLDESAVAFLHDENSARDGQSPVALLLNTLLQRTLPGGEDIRPAANIRGLAGAIIDLRMTVDDMRGLSLSDVKQTHGNESGVARYAQMTYSDAFNYRVGAVKDLASEVFSILLNAITDEKNTEKYLQDLERQYWEDLFKDGEDNGTTEKQP